MKACIFCHNDINDLAKKCPYCQSFQSPFDEPKKPFDIASLVISFVGVVAGIATLVAGVFAYFGFKGMVDLNERSENILKKAEQKMEAFDDQAKRLASDEKDFKGTKVEFNALLLKGEYARFQEAMEGLTLVDLSKTIDLLNELRNIHETVSHTNELPKDTTLRDQKLEIIKVIEAVFAFQDGNDQRVIELLSADVSDKSINKHRMMVAAYDELYKRAQKTNAEDAYGYLGKEAAHAKTAWDLALSINRPAAIAIAGINYGNSLITRGNSADFEMASDVLLKAKRQGIKLCVTCYNLAGLAMKRHDLDGALTNLQLAKEAGEFGTEKDVRYFKEDPWFAELLNTDNQLYRDRLNQILKVSNTPTPNPTPGTSPVTAASPSSAPSASPAP